MFIKLSSFMGILILFSVWLIGLLIMSNVIHLESLLINYVDTDAKLLVQQQVENYHVR